MPCFMLLLCWAPASSNGVLWALFQLCTRDALLLLGAGHPEYYFDLAYPSTIILGMRAYTDLEIGYHLAHMTCEWCTGPLFGSCCRVSIPRTGIITSNDPFIIVTDFLLALRSTRRHCGRAAGPWSRYSGPAAWCSIQWRASSLICLLLLPWI